MFRGQFCEQVVQYEGKPCDGDKECERGLKCKQDTKTCFEPALSPESKREKVEAVFNGILSDETLAVILKNIGIQFTATTLSRKGIEALLHQALVKRTLNIAESEIMKQAALKLPEGMAARVVASKLMNEATEKAASRVVSAIASEVNPIGMLFTVVDLFGMLGVALDMFDTRGLNEQMLQSVLTQFKKKFDKLVNESPAARRNNIVFPIPVFPPETVAFKAKVHEQDTQIAVDAAEYLSKLLVNSNGQVIQPLFLNQDAQELEDLKTKYPLYWRMSGQNERVFRNLVKYGWSIWVGVALLLASIVLICVFTNEGVRAKVKRK
jgi:hypothetical protein